MINMDLEALHDKFKINDLNTRYAFSIDNGDATTFADCFVPDGVLCYRGDEISGRDKLMQHAKTHQVLPTRHYLTGPLYEFSQDRKTCSGKTAVLVTLATHQGYRIFFSGHFEDELANISDRWYLTRREAVDLALPGTPDLRVGAADPLVSSELNAVYASFEGLGNQD